MKRIHWHWTAGAPGINAKEADSYNFIITWPDGEIVPSVPVDRQKPPLVNGAYAAHTRGANSWAIGIAIDAMAEAQERPFSLGRHPITPKQLDALVRLSRDLGRQYGIPVTRETMLSHAEVQPTLGIKQNAKWDISWLPGMDAPGDPVAVGDKIRAMIKNTGARMNLFADDFDPEPIEKPVASVPVLAMGSRGEAVRALQARLADLRYFSGKNDGIFGPRTHGAVMEFQADNGLVADGKVGPQTRAVLATAVPRALREVTRNDLAESRTIQTATEGKTITAATVTVAGAGAAVGAIEQAIEVAQRAGSLVAVLASAGPWVIALLAVSVGGWLIWRKFQRVEALRVEDAQTGANDSR